jgi:hypothetical protein
MNSAAALFPIGIAHLISYYCFYRITALGFSENSDAHMRRICGRKHLTLVHAF